MDVMEMVMLNVTVNIRRVTHLPRMAVLPTSRAVLMDLYSPFYLYTIGNRQPSIFFLFYHDPLADLSVR